jgi:dihydroorotate dehydrogenase
MSLAAKFTHLLPPEAAHAAAMLGLDAYHALRMSWMIASDLKPNPQQVMGLTFDNPIGLAAGLDKNGDHIDALGALGFGFIEVGTVTPKPQDGNPKPRLFRLPEHQAIINRMGFNNKGLEHMVGRIKRRKYSGVLGVNIGKNATTPLENALDDYRQCLDAVHGYADYIVVNLSSPNTPNLRQLQFGEPLKHLVSSLREQCYRLDAVNEKRVPLVVKIAPDMSHEDLLSVADTLMEASVDGIIATNTTIERDAVLGHPYAQEAGGLSGVPVRSRSTEVVTALYQHLKGELPIIGVGGIFDERSAAEKREAGASLLQLYTGFIYRGSDAISAAARGFKQANLSR